MNELEQLSSLLTNSAENERLNDLEHRLNNIQQRSHELAEILPNTILSLQSQENFINALQDSVDNCVKQAIQQDPNSYVKALLPAGKIVLNQAADNALQPIKLVLKDQQNKFNDLIKQLHDIKLVHTNQNKQIQRQKQNIDELKQNNTTELEKNQTALNTQLNELE
ncbi:MAG: hypothetical protein IMF12_00165, partial [Proteobacteria bacterium]|nr:hypothetical protein [Pseudomonadota bacterium]